METKNPDANIAGSSRTAPTRNKEAQRQIVELVVFRMGTEEFAAEINQVREVITKGIITPIPESPAFIKGINNVRGEIAVAVDLRQGLSLDSASGTQAKHIIITEQQNNLFGLIVDEVTAVLRIPEDQIKPPPDVIATLDRVSVKGVITIANRLIILLDLSKVLSEESLGKLADIRTSILAQDQPIGGDEAKRLQQQARRLQQQTATPADKEAVDETVPDTTPAIA